MRACGPAGRANVTNHLALVHVPAFANACSKAAHMAIKRLQMIAVADDDGIAIAIFTARLIDVAVASSADGRAIGSTEVNTCVHLGITQQRVNANAKTRCEMGA